MHTGLNRQPKTDSKGRFDLETRAPAIVFRKDRFQSLYWRVAPGSGLSFTLTGITPSPATSCRWFARCVSLQDGYMGSFCFPNVAGVRVTESSLTFAVGGFGEG